MALTVEGIARSKPKARGDRWISDKSPERGRGRLLVRISPNGNKRFYYRYAVEGRDRIVIAMEPFTENPRPGAMTLTEARARAAEYTEYHKDKTSRDVKGHLAKLERDAKRAEAAEAKRLAREAAEAEAARTYNLRSLAAEYVRGLERRGKSRSAQDARNIFKNHLDNKPLAAKPAKDVARAEVTALLRELVEVGKGRTAAKLRSYLRAAYATAMRAEGDATAPASMIAYQIGANPVADTESLSAFTKTRDRTLTDAELHAYWLRLADVKPHPVRGALQLATLLGGQRIAQLLRLKRADVDMAAGFLILRDPKGKRAQPRVHELPITSAALAILRPLVERAEALGSDWVFTSEGAKPDRTDEAKPVYPDTLTTTVRGIAATMKKAKEARSAFMLSDLRRTAETMMAGMGISQDLRAQIQSHGLGGVQSRHYNRHDYRLEKLAALTAWAQRIESGPAPATVANMSAKRRRTRA